MSQLAVKNQDTSAIEKVLIEGDLAPLNPGQRIKYVHDVCGSLGLNPLTRPFEFLKFNGKVMLYAKRDATDQLRKIHSVSIKIVSTEVKSGVYIVTAEASDKEGRTDSSTGAVAIEGLKGDALANAFLKAETKAKRRVTLSICGLGMLDESEVDSLPKEERTVEPQKPQTKVIQNLAPGGEDIEILDEDPLEAIGMMVCPKVLKKFAGQRIKDIGPYELRNYCEWLKKSASDQGKELTGAIGEFVEASLTWLREKNGAK